MGIQDWAHLPQILETAELLDSFYAVGICGGQIKQEVSTTVLLSQKGEMLEVSIWISQSVHRQQHRVAGGAVGEKIFALKHRHEDGLGGANLFPDPSFVAASVGDAVNAMRGKPIQ